MGSLRSLARKEKLTQRKTFEICRRKKNGCAYCLDWSSVPQPCLEDAIFDYMEFKEYSPELHYENLSDIPDSYDSVTYCVWTDGTWKVWSNMWSSSLGSWKRSKGVKRGQS